MNVRTHKAAGWLATLMGAAALLAGATALADHNQADHNQADHKDRDERTHADSGMSRERIISMVEKRFKARVVRADEIDVNGRPAYQLRLLSDAGRIWTVRVDARTGEQL